ncbi:hypothetical protein [Nocardioides sp. NPDC127503]|uniref:hypothetical protein n=1 Tax=Nocardioides sp. NPDC127503 TaxID=3154516 RepID=UPI003327470D
MSDNWIRLIPTDASWEPAQSSVDLAVAYVVSLFSRPGDSADEVSAVLHNDVALIDSGVNTSSFKCTICSSVTDVSWVFEVVGERSSDLSDLDVVLPCCGVTSSLNELAYDWAMGFARFEIGVLNGTRARYELDESELRQVGELLGHPVRQILAHY